MSEFGSGFIYCLINFAKHFDLELPKNLPLPIKKMVKELQDIALDYGHGSKMMIGMSEETYRSIRKMLNIIALAIDKWLKVKTSKALWD